MKNIIFHIQKIFVKTYKPPPLGRWNLETCNKKINKKIDLANEDHCGPCGNKYFLPITTKDEKE